MRSALPDSARIRDAGHRGVEANARLTGATAVVLLVLLIAEGLTIPFIVRLLTPHVFIGMLLIPPVLLKIGSTGYRFARYYAGAPAYRRKGPPPIALRVLGPFLVLLTVVMFASGVALLFVGLSLRGPLLRVHQASFVLWFAAMTVHVVSHLLDTARLAPRDYYARTRSQVSGAGLRQWSLAAALALGFMLGAMVVDRVGPYFAR